MKCDVIIPVYNAPEYVKLCVYTLFKNTDKELLGKVYLMNDNSNEFTKNLLENLKDKYNDKVVLINNETNLGFIKNVNKGFSICESDCVLLLNTDCFVAKNTIGKLMNHIKNNKEIGLICPISSNAANLTLDMYPGFSYMMMDQLLEKKFSGKSFDACTVVGNCLMITKKCIEKTGYFDEIFGMGYCDETDYQFKAMKKGFQAKVAIDTYVFHKAEMSFNTTNTPREERLKHNLEIFWSRWKKDYDLLMEEYVKNDPIKYIKNHISKKDLVIDYDFMFLLPFASKTSGGVRVIVDLINYLSMNNINIGMLNLYPSDYNEIMAFQPCNVNDINNIKTKAVIGTIYESMFLADKLAKKFNAKTLYFSQGYEFVFENGKRYGEVEMSFKMADYIITVSKYLSNVYKDLLSTNSIPIVNGIDTDLTLTKKNKINDKKVITMVLRNEPRKADYMVLDLMKYMTVKFNNIVINLIINNKDMILGVNNNDTVTVNKYYGPMSRPEIYNILKNTDIFIDTSISEGFGLMPLEAMAFGVVPVVSNSFGINDFIENGKNGIIIDQVNDPEKYIEQIKILLNDSEKMKRISTEAYKTAKKFDFDNVVSKYIDVFNDIINNNIKPNKNLITKEELDLLSNYLISNKELNKTIKISNRCNEGVTIKRKRSTMFLRLFKEIIKANVYFIKVFFKIIFKKIVI